MTKERIRACRVNFRRQRIHLLSREPRQLITSSKADSALGTAKRLRRLLAQLPPVERRAVLTALKEDLSDLLVQFCFEAARLLNREDAGRIIAASARHPWPSLSASKRREMGMALGLSI